MVVVGEFGVQPVFVVVADRSAVDCHATGRRFGSRPSVDDVHEFDSRGPAGESAKFEELLHDTIVEFGV